MSSTSAIAAVLLPIVRRVLPTVIANDIIGVSSLNARFSSGPPFYDRVKLSKEVYNNFLRINNRKTYHDPEHIKDAGYPYLEMNHIGYYPYCDRIKWCNDTIGKFGYIEFKGTFFFKDQNDYMSFVMRWT